MKNEWITNRIPLRSDATDRKGLVWICIDGKTPHEEYYDEVFLGQAWMPITTPEKPKRWTVDELSDGWCVYDEIGLVAVATYLPTREAAERIAAIYEEFMP